MSIRLPSLQKTVDDYFSGDPAFIQPPADATPDVLAQYADQLRIARETGNWQPLIRPGATPTAFQMRQVPRDVVFALRDAMRPNDKGIAEIGVETGLALWFRAALRSAKIFEDGESYAVKFVDEKYGKSFASEDVLRLDEAHPGLVFELANNALRRAMSIVPKS